MPPPEPTVPEAAKVPIILLAGASGYVGGRLLPLLEQQPVVLRCLARNPDKLRPLVKGSTQVVKGVPLAFPNSVDATDAHIYVADMVNLRLLRLKKQFRAEATSR